MNIFSGFYSRLKRARPWLYGAVAVFTATGLLTLFLAASGYKPLGLFSALLRSMTGLDSYGLAWNPRYPAEWISASVPVLLCALSMAFAAKAGMFNIGAEGQYIVGLSVAQACAVILPPVPVLGPLLSVAAAVAAASAWGMVAGALKARLGASEVVVTLMLNFVALYLSRIFTMALAGATTVGLPDYSPAFSLHIRGLDRLTHYSTLNGGIFIAALALLLWYAILEKTSLGFAVKATGRASLAARSAGIDIGSIRFLSMGIAGAYAGLGGALVALGTYPCGRVLEGFDGFGFTGIAAALVGGGSAVGTLVGSLVFGLINSSGILMQSHGIPREAVPVFTGIVTAIMALRLFPGAGGADAEP